MSLLPYKDKEKEKERNKTYYAKHRNQLLKQKRDYRKNNLTKLLEYERFQAKKHRENRNKRDKEYYYKNHENKLQYAREHNKKKMLFKYRHIPLPSDPRIGICNWCRAVKGIDCKRTALHHDNDQYDNLDPLRYTIELCNSCHCKETNRSRNDERHLAKILLGAELLIDNVL